jgi:DNA-binding SARP family transcriptional activator
MSDTGGRPELRICVIGAFRVLTHDYQDLTPNGRKARALLAILALTRPTRRRSRPALQDKLWSDRGPEQGAASLRQTLTEIRRAFGERYRECLVSDMRGVGLDPDRVIVDLDTADLSEFASTVEAPLLLEDIDVADQEFEHWLRDRRTEFEQRIASSKPDVLALSSEPGVVHTRSAPARPWIRILAPSATSSESGLFLSRLVGDRIAQGLVDQWGIEVRDDREGPQGVRVRVDALPMSREVAVNVALLSADGALQLWSGSGAISLESGFVSDAPRLQTLINQSVDVAAQYLNRTASSPEACVAFGQAFEAVQRMLKIELAEVDSADALLASAYEADPRPVYLAWRAYARAFYVGEHLHVDRRLAIEESEELARRALEADPHNATVLALTSHVYGFVLRKWEFAHQLAELSVKYNPSLPLGHAYLGKAKLELGEREAGYRETFRGMELSGQAPYRHMLYTAYGLASLATGRFDEALRAAEIVHSMVPIFRPLRRYLVPLYLRLGERDKARDAYQKMSLIEPSFSLKAMREQSYPSYIIRASGLLTCSDSDL